MDVIRVRIQLPDDMSAVLEERWSGGMMCLVAIRRLLGLESRFQVHALLKEHSEPLQYTVADLEDDLRAQRKLEILPSR
jgi:hypothetical protein